MLWLIPAATLSTILFRLYNVRYEITRDGIEWTVGVLWTSQRVSKMTFSDVLTVETKQTLLGRMLDIGNVEIGSAQTDDVEIIFSGVGSPRKVQRLIEIGRDKADEADL